MNFLETLESNNTSEIEKALAKRANSNLRFFEKNSKELFKIATSKPKEYNLLVNRDGINIYNLNSKDLVYPQINGRHMFVEGSKNIAFSPLENEKWGVISNNLALSKMDESRFPATSSIVNRIIDSALNQNSLHKSLLHMPSKSLPITSIFGLAGGLFLEYLIEQNEFIHSLFIYEESPDFFRISTFFVDYEKMYKKIGRRNVLLIIGQSYDSKIIKQFFSQRKITSNFIRLELNTYSTPNSEEIKRAMKLEQNSNSRGWGTFEDEMLGLRNTFENVEYTQKIQKYPILNSSKKIDMPICVVGSGHSLDELLPFIKKNQNNMIIFSSGTAIRPLRAAGVEIDFQIEIERMEYLVDILEESGLKDLRLIGGNIVQPKVLELAKKSFIFLRASSSAAYIKNPKKIIEWSYPIVGNATFSLACNFSDTIYLCGLDMAYKEGKKKHADNSFYVDEKSEIPKNAIEVKGNLSSGIYADSLFALSREMVEYAILDLKPKNVYNLSDGVYIMGTKPTTPKECTFAKGDKKRAIELIESAFEYDSEKIFEDIKLEEYLEKLSIFIDGIKNILRADVKSKKDLFITLDSASSFVQSFRSKERFLGTLIGGSIFHILSAIFVSMMHIKRDDISAQYRDFIEIFEQGIEQFKVRVKLTIAMKSI